MFYNKKYVFFFYFEEKNIAHLPTNFLNCGLGNSKPTTSRWASLGKKALFTIIDYHSKY